MALRRGYTLMEMVVYMALFALVGLLLASVFSISKRAQQSTTASYVVSGQTDTTMRTLRQDLQETVLTSIYASASPFPYVSLCSARDTGSGKLLISEYGVPRWCKHIYYGLGSNHNLMRWEVPLTADNRLPQLAPPATSIPSDARPVLRNVLAPHQSVAGVVGASKWGGFRVQFVRRAGSEKGVETLADSGPATNKTAAQDNTRLVEIELSVRENDMRMAGSNFYSVKMRVCPQY